MFVDTINHIYQDSTEVEEDEEEETILYRPFQKKRKQMYSSATTSPEPPTTPTRKTTAKDPNRKDKIGRTKLFQATTAGHLDKVKELIQQGANVNFKDNANWTPLHEAANNGRFEIAQYLVSCGAKINVRGYGLDTPLHDACQSESQQCVQLLVDAGADVFALNEKNQRPIDLCTTDECKSIVTAKMKQLDSVMKRDKSGKSLLHHACLEEREDRARALLAQGADVNAKDNQNATPLHLACAKGYLNVVQLLIQQGALVNILGTELNETPLHQASRYGHEPVVRYLIEKAEADVNMENKSRKNPYQVAAAHPPVRQLLTARMDELRFEKEACNALDDTARKMALQNEPERQLTREERKIQSYMGLFAKLDGDVSTTATDDDFTPTRRRKRTTSSRKSTSVEPASPRSPRKSTSTFKLDPFKKDTSGGTQLHKFAGRGDVDLVEQLLEAGARPDDADYAGWTALHEASLKGHVDVVKVLLKYGASANVKGGDHDTPLHDAAENNHYEIVELLLEHGADPFARNLNDAEPIDIAIQHDFQDIILILQNANPVKKKKRTKVKKEIMTDDLKQDEQLVNKPSPTIKKRRLVQAADREKSVDKEEQEPKKKPLRLKKLRQRSCSPDYIPVKLEKEELALKEKENLNNLMNGYSSSNKKYTSAPKIIDSNQVYHRHSPIHTPPPEQWATKQRSHSPLYTIQSNINTTYVIDLQVALFIGMHTTEEFWKSYSNLFQKDKKAIQSDLKQKLWPTMKYVLNEEKSHFMTTPLNFIVYQDVKDLIKRDFSHLDLTTTICLDITFEEKKAYCLPPKIAMKMKKCGYKLTTF